MCRKQAGESSCNFLKEIQDLIGPHYAQKWRKKMQIQSQIKWLLDEFA